MPTEAEWIAQLEDLVKAARAALLPYVWAPHWHVRDPVVEAEPQEIDLPLDEEPEYHLAVTEADVARTQQVFEQLEMESGLSNLDDLHTGIDVNKRLC
jgi:hypothetical protein